MGVSTSPAGPRHRGGGPGGRRHRRGRSVPGRHLVPAGTAGHGPERIEFTPGSDATGATQRVHYLDGLRAFAATYVVLHHISFTQRSPSHVVSELFKGGNLAVGVFIVVSGYSLTVALRRRPLGYWEFMRRRAWRILPPFYAALVLSVVLIEVAVHTRTGTVWDDSLPLSWKGVGINLALLQDVFPTRAPNPVFWSIAIEFHLYFVLPAFLWLRRRATLWSFALPAAAGTALLWVAWGGVPYIGFPPQFLVLFLLGIVAAEVANWPTGPLTRLRSIGATWATVVFVVLAAAGDVALQKSPDGYAAALLAGVGTAVLMIGLSTAGDRHLSVRLLESSWIAGIGLFSYSLYLVHAPIIQIVWQDVVRPLHLGAYAAFAVMMLLGLVAALVGAFVFHVFFERPFVDQRSIRALGSVIPFGRRRMRDARGDVVATEGV